MKVNQKSAGIVLQYVSVGIGIVISLIYTPIMLKLLGQDEYGLFNISSSAISYLCILNFGLGNSYIRFFVKSKMDGEKSEVVRLNGTYIILYTLIGLISLIAGAVIISVIPNFFSNTLDNVQIKKVKIMMWIATINIAISFPMSVFDSHILAQERFVVHKLLYIIKEFLKPASIILLLLLGYKAIGVMTATLFANVAISVVTMLYCIFKLKFRVRLVRIEWTYVRDLFGYSFFIFINMLINEINWNVDKFFLGVYYGVIETAIYSVAAQISTYFRTFGNAVSNVFIPKIHKMINGNCTKEALTRLFIKIGRIQFYILMLVSSMFVVWGKSFIKMWSGKENEGAYFVTLLLIIPTMIPLIQNIGIEIQRAMNMHKFRAIAYSAIAVLNIVITIPCCQLFGSIGAALGTAVSVFLGNGIIMNIYYDKKIGIDIKQFWRSILSICPSMVIPFITGILVMIFVDLGNIIWFSIFAVIYVLIYVFCIYLLAMNAEEKAIVNKCLLSIRRLVKK